MLVRQALNVGICVSNSGGNLLPNQDWSVVSNTFVDSRRRAVAVPFYISIILCLAPLMNIYIELLA